MKAITTRGLSRSFDEKPALDGLDLEVDRGEVFGLLGHNGAGKTTAVRLLNGVLAPSAGSARVLGLDPACDGESLRRRTGVSTETPSLDDRMTGRAALGYFGELYGVPAATLSQRTDSLLAEFGLTEAAERKIGGYSKGMKQRLALARALLHDPELLFLDEPTSGLDPVATRSVTDSIARMSRLEGKTVLLCTHNLAQAQRLCDRVAVLERGRVVAQGSPRELAERLGRGRRLVIDVRRDDADKALSLLRSQPDVSDVEATVGRDSGRVSVTIAERESIPELVTLVVASGAGVYGVAEEEPSLEDVYFALHTTRAEEPR